MTTDASTDASDPAPADKPGLGHNGGPDWRALLAGDDAKANRSAALAGSPLLVSVREARRQLGDIGTTAFYDAVKRHGIALVRLGGRSLVPMAEIERVVAELRAKGASDASDKAKALASRSVAARRARRGSAIAAAPPPRSTRRGRRGSTSA